MNRKKSIIISIGVVLLIVVIVAGVTSAYLAAITNEEQVDAGSGMLGINYSAPDDITGILNASSDRSGGLLSVATASLESGSEEALFNMYVTPTALSDNLKIKAFKWEVVVDGTVINYGDFSDASIGVGTPIKVVNGYKLSTTTTTFNIYIWLDASLITSGISGASFGAKIGADSVPITGGF